jgi:hypothetical protein
MVDYGGAQNPRNDGQGLFEAGRQQERQQLGFVADFGEGNNAC